MKKFLFLAMACLFAAVSCNKDSDFSGLKPLEEDQSFFVNINIGSVDALTRAGELSDGDYQYSPNQDPNFNEGTKDENKVSSIYLIFYDANGDRVSTTQVQRDNSKPAESYGNNNNGRSIFNGIVQIDVKHGSLQPAYVMCFINPITAQNFDINPSFATLKDLQKTTRPRIIDKNDNFAMSKSVYYGPDRAKEGYNSTWDDDPTKYEKIVATPIPEEKTLFKTRKEAEDAIEDYEKADNKTELHNPVLDIYVERYAVKVNFKINEEAENNNSLTIGEKTLKFIPEYWAVNAYESETYICKSFLDEELNEDMSYKTMNDALGADKAWYWNNPARHRCYWAQTPAYYAANYPRVADDIIDQRESFAGEGGYALGYYSYNEIVANAEDAAGEWTELSRKARNLQNSKDKTLPIYARENTVAGASLKAANDNPLASPKAAIASIALVGHYEINGQSTGDRTFYVMGNKTNGYRFFTDDNDEMLTYLVNTTIPFYTNKNGTNTFFDYGIENYRFTNEDYKKYFTIEHPNVTVRAYGISVDEADKALVIDSRFVTIQLNDEVILGNNAAPIYAYINGNYMEVNEGNIDFINQQMLYAAGTVQQFKDGLAYFTIPIKHLGFYRDGNKNAEKNANDKTFDWSAVQSGDFGLVRNHIYTITVDNIEGLGNAIPNPDDPIVPPTDPEEYFIGARIVVLNWAVVPEQHESL